MTKTILIYPPFCTPASPPYSITYLHDFLKDNLDKSNTIESLDLNLLFHKMSFPSYHSFCKGLKADFNREEYAEQTSDFLKQTRKDYAENNRKVIAGEVPALFEDMLSIITDSKPDIVAFSIVYSSQAFYALALTKALTERGIRVVVGGPAVNEKLRQAADAALANEVELLAFIQGKDMNDIDHESMKCNTVLDFSIYPLDDYFTPSPVIPIKTTSSCHYKQCAFCTHHQGSHYFETDLDLIRQSIEKSGQKHVFFVDDGIHKKRLLELAEIIRPLGVRWMCQLRPTSDFDKETLKTLHDSGLRLVMWGVESGCDRVLTAMRKGTNTADIRKVIADSKEVGIINALFIMFGFPTETEEEFRQTVSFLEDNSDSIDLISTSVFGLQKGSPAFEAPEKFGITRIEETERTILDSSISYEVSSGMSQERAAYLRKSHKKTFEKINDFPRSMNFFREHLLCLR